MMGTEIFKIDASWAEKLTKTRVSFLMTPTVYKSASFFVDIIINIDYTNEAKTTTISSRCRAAAAVSVLCEERESSTKFCSIPHLSIFTFSRQT